jgi:aminopeptidase N
MTRIALITLVTLMMPINPQDPRDSRNSPDPRLSGIPLTLATERAGRIKDLRYDLRFTIPSEQTAPVSGIATITFTLNDATRPLSLDFTPATVKATTANGEPSTPAVSPDHLTIPASSLRQGRNSIALEFTAGDAALNRNPEFLYTLFVPARAHLTFPCFDQPDLKARWTLSLDVPAEWEALANGAAIETSVRDGRKIVRFAETAPLSTYLFAFAAGRFSIETADRGGRTFRMFHRETDAAKVARNREAIFDLHTKALTWLEEYTGIRYPWSKFDFLLVPSFQFGGMEHAGAIFYNASALLLDPSATQNQKLGRASLIAHETAHMWFGDLVTMRWFDDVWMKEVFANFIAAKIVNPSFPEINHDLRFLLAHYPAAYEIDRTPGTNPIRQRLDNLNEAGSLYGAIIYQKAPIVMRQLEAILGETPFKEGLRQYLRAHEFGNATWPDLIAVLDERTPDDLAAWSHAWVEEPGRPIVRTELEIGGGRISRLTFVERDPIPARGLTWTQRLQVTIGLADGERTLPVRIANGRADVPEARGLAAPRFVLPSGRGVGYAGYELDAASLAYLLADLPEIGDPLTRGAAWVTLWDQMLDGRATATALVELALSALPRESDEQNVQRILGYTQRAYWKFLPPRSRSRRPAHRRRAPVRPGKRADVEPQIGVVLGAARHGAIGCRPRVARTRVAQDRERSRSHARGAGLHQPRAGTCGEGSAGLARDCRRRAGPDREPRSQGAVRVRAAGTIRRRDRAGCVRRTLEGAGVAPARAVGARGPVVRAPSAARRCGREAHSAEPRDAARDPTDRRHLLSEALDGRDPRRTQLRRGGPDGEAISRGAAGGISRSPATRRPVVGGRALQSRRTLISRIQRIPRIGRTPISLMQRIPRIGMRAIRVIRIDPCDPR